MLAARREKALATSEREFAGKTNREIFSTIYESGVWGHQTDSGYFSGSGSHEDTLVAPYVASVTTFLSSLPIAPDVVDLGCGDFNVGRQIRPFCGSYTACDIVPALISHNSQAFAGLNVNFHCTDIADDALPAGDIVFIRQVLQHLDNDHIAKVVPKLASFHYAIITEHLSSQSDFVANLDKPAGKGIRLGRHSGVVLTSPPFNMPVQSERILCEVGEDGGIIRTTLYRFR